MGVVGGGTDDWGSRVVEEKPRVEGGSKEGETDEEESWRRRDDN